VLGLDREGEEGIVNREGRILTGRGGLDREGRISSTAGRGGN